MNGSLLPLRPGRSAGRARVLARWSWLLLGVVLMIAAPGCRQEALVLEPAARHTVSNLSSGEALGFALDVHETGPLLVRVEGFEAALESRIVGVAGQAGSRVQIPYLRGIPIFQVVDQTSARGAGEVLVEADDLTRNARLHLYVFELAAASRRDRTRIQAYRAYEAATQSTDDESPELWRERAELFRSASSGFKRAGDTEEQLWAEYLEAYVHYFPLADHGRAAKLAADIQQRAGKHGFQEIELMAMQLEGQSLIERAAGDSLEVAKARAERGLTVLRQAVDLAAGMGYRYEQAFALNSRGIGYFYQGRFDEAEQHYRQALAIALDIQDSALPNQLRGNLALVAERQGDLYGALAELQAINAQLGESGQEADRAHNWSELSRLYERLYLFPESIEAQGRAMEIWRALNSAEGKGRSGLSLAHSYQAIGHSQRALAVLTVALADLEAAGFSRGLRDGYGLLAQLYRGQGQLEQMLAARERQGGYLSSDAQQARFLYQQGLDALASHSVDPSTADELFRQAETAAQAADDQGLAVRSRLQVCAIADQPGEACSPVPLQLALDEMLRTAIPSHAFEARLLYAQVLARAGEPAQAWMVLDSLVDDIQLYRHTLPGVLGAWYWEARTRIFGLYMNLALRNFEDPVRSLLAFNRLMNTSLGGIDSGVEAGELGELRGLLAQLAQGRTPDSEVRQAIDRRLLKLRSQSNSLGQALEAQELATLLAGLPSGTGLVAYYLDPAEAWAWRASADGVELIRLEHGEAIAGAIERARIGLRVVGNSRLEEDLEQLGDLLLAPLGSNLPETVYLLAAGPLAGFPFEALRMNGRYLGQDHVVVNALSLKALSRAGRSAPVAGDWRDVLLAGNPLQPGNGLAALPSVSRELDGLADLLSDRDITDARGKALDGELFEQAEFASADLVHIASHAEINLEYPELSRILVSAEGEEETYLTPLDLRGTPISADLVVLSACETTGINAFSFDSNLGFVSGFLQSGAGAVVATQWPVGDAFAAEFVLDFYTAMLEGVTTPAALAQVKRRHIARAAASGKPDWPAFQIYVN